MSVPKPNAPVKCVSGGSGRVLTNAILHEERDEKRKLEREKKKL